MRIARPSPALLVASLALFVSLGGVSYGLAKNVIGSKQIKNNSVRGKDVRNRGLTGKDVKRNSLRGTQINEATLGKVPNAASADIAASANSAGRAHTAGEAENVKVLPLMKVAPSATNDDLDAARAAATRIPLYSAGSLTIYAKCFADPPGPDMGNNPGVTAEVFVESAQNGAMMSADESELDGNSDDLLNAGTPEVDRVMTRVSSYAVPGGGTANSLEPENASGFMAAAPDGTSLAGMLTSVTKVGNLADPVSGNGLYGAGDACLFGGFITAG